MNIISNIQYPIPNIKYPMSNIHKTKKQSGSLSRGFTLIEILIVVGIIAALAVMAGMSYSSVLQRSRDGKRKSDIEQIRSALELYRADKGYYPPDGGAINDFVNVTDMLDAFEGYINAIPRDPSGDEYKYMATDFDIATSRYYSYCVSALLETIETFDSTCGGVAPGGYNYARRNP